MAVYVPDGVTSTQKIPRGCVFTSQWQLQKECCCNEGRGGRSYLSTMEGVLEEVQAESKVTCFDVELDNPTDELEG